LIIEKKTETIFKKQFNYLFLRKFKKVQINNYQTPSSLRDTSPCKGEDNICPLLDKEGIQGRSLSTNSFYLEDNKSIK
jgi:hypothetical protein